MKNADYLIKVRQKNLDKFQFALHTDAFTEDVKSIRDFWDLPIAVNNVADIEAKFEKALKIFFSKNLAAKAAVLLKNDFPDPFPRLDTGKMSVLILAADLANDLAQEILVEAEVSDSPEALKAFNIQDLNPLSPYAAYTLAKSMVFDYCRSHRQAKEFIEEKKRELENVPEEAKSLYLNLIGGAIHDIYVLRGLFGSPRKVLFTRAWEPGCLVSVLEYSSALHCIYSTGPWNREVDDFDIGFKVYGKKKVVDFRFTFDSYLRNDPTSVIVKEMEGDAFVEKRIRPSFDDPFKRELIHFHDCILEDKEPISNGREAKKDLELLLNIARGIGER